MGYKIYGEDQPKELPITDFLIEFLIGAIGFATQIGWVLVSFQFING